MTANLCPDVRLRSKGKGKANKSKGKGKDSQDKGKSKDKVTKNESSKKSRRDEKTRCDCCQKTGHVYGLNADRDRKSLLMQKKDQ